MLSKEECEKALQMLDYPSNEWDVIEELIKEHFELVEEYKKVQLESQKYFDELCDGGWHDKEYQEFKNPQPYKFEDLKEGMWVYDKKYHDCIECHPFVSYDDLKYVVYHSEDIYDEIECLVYHVDFEENRFYPVQMANRKDV